MDSAERARRHLSWRAAPARVEEESVQFTNLAKASLRPCRTRECQLTAGREASATEDSRSSPELSMLDGAEHSWE